MAISIVPPIWTQNDNSFLRPILQGINDLARSAVNGITSLVDGVKRMVEYIETLASDTVDLIKTVASVEEDFRSLIIEWLPTPVVLALLSGLVVVVLYKILGRS